MSYSQRRRRLGVPTLHAGRSVRRLETTRAGSVGGEELLQLPPTGISHADEDTTARGRDPNVWLGGRALSRHASVMCCRLSRGASDSGARMCRHVTDVLMARVPILRETGVAGKPFVRALPLSVWVLDKNHAGGKVLADVDTGGR